VPAFDPEKAAAGIPQDSADIPVGSGSQRMFQRAVVVDVLGDLSLWTEEQFEKLQERLTEEAAARSAEAPPPDLGYLDDLRDAPRNSILARLITPPSKGRNEFGLHVFMPFFSSHFCLPCKPGEVVWVFFEDPTFPGSTGYWVTRLPAHEVNVEDANYTHYDRWADPTTLQATKAFLDKDNKVIKSFNPGFPNGPVYVLPDQSQYTLFAADAFEKIVAQSIEAISFTIEPIPRYTKRPGDLVLQGSHNATIVLGTGRGYNDTDAIDADPAKRKSNAMPAAQLKPGHGAIDLVVGRGRLNVELDTLAGAPTAPSAWPLNQGTDLIKGPGEKPARTEPQVVMNARQTFEANKNPEQLDEKITNRLYNASEGDPDFVNDAARLYLTMKSDPDKDFSLIGPQIPGLFNGNAPQATDAAASVLKADEVRIIARKTGAKSPTEAAQPVGKNKREQPIIGSIRLIKEGALDDDAACIYMLPDGTVQVSGKKIQIGRAKSDGGQKTDGDGQPYIMYQELEELWQALCDSIDAFCNEALKNTTPGYGAPSPQLTAAAAQLQLDVAGLKPEIQKVKSKRIFGE